jgi:hypothetical protein
LQPVGAVIDFLLHNPGLTSESIFDLGKALPEQAFIAFFISILLVFWNKVRLKWYTNKGELDSEN